MSSERHQRVSDVFSEARRRPPDERAAFLDEACRDDPDLRAEVESLLASADRAGDDLLESANLGPGAALWKGAAGAAFDSLVGTRVGRYEVQRLIAEGGMGSVYEAFQEQPRRSVALKVMRQGPMSEAALRRFTYEWQVLGRLQHPGIAQVYEADLHEGDGAPGRFPYFAMEYVQGARNLIEYCDEQRLDRRARIELFIRVCDAVAHGHQRGVIHRDLKPGNLLVDSEGHPKVIDFGIARATDSDQTLVTMQTSVGDVLGTVQYMSPEQASTHSQDIDTRSDVYSLGVVLYELLCGQLPYDLSGMLVFEALRIIPEVSPRRPSSIDRALRGDLEAIVLKALEKKRRRRYQSVGELARDLRRFLDREPVLARAPSTAYQLTRFVQRHRAVSAAAAAAFLGLAAFVYKTIDSNRKIRTSKEGIEASEKGLKASEKGLKEGLQLVRRFLQGVQLEPPKYLGLGDAEVTFQLRDCLLGDLLPPSPRRELVARFDAEKLGVLQVCELDGTALQELWTKSSLDVIWNEKHRLLLFKSYVSALSHVLPEMAGYDSVGCPSLKVEPTVVLAVEPEKISGVIFPLEGPHAELKWAMIREPVEVGDPKRRWKVQETRLEPLKEGDDQTTLARLVLPLQSIANPKVEVHAVALIEPDGRLRPFELTGDLGSKTDPAVFQRMVPVDLPSLTRAVGVRMMLARDLSVEGTEQVIRDDPNLTEAERETSLGALRTLMENWRFLHSAADDIRKDKHASAERLKRALEAAETAVLLHDRRCPGPEGCLAGWYAIRVLAAVQVRAEMYERALETLDRCDSIWSKTWCGKGEPNALDLSFRAMALYWLNRKDESQKALKRARELWDQGKSPEGEVEETKSALHEAKMLLGG